ncbi:MAG TPA: AAA family ATPase, partial [Clostridia bacterium]|nr:AAA family ATPase [Clostridia bacterium]
MIKKIQRIASFGVFTEFQASAALPEFKQFNLIYGWNYSGKTTLSRAFRCFEQKQPHADFPAAQVQLKAHDGTVYHLSAPHGAPVFRVFNSDFVRENLSFDFGSATPILVLGAEDIAKQESLKAKKAERDSLNLSKESNKNKREEKQMTIERALTNYARDFIKNPLTVPNYDKTRFEPHVRTCKKDPESHLLDDESLSECLSVFRSNEKKPTLSVKVNSLSPLAPLKEKASSLLSRIVTANVPVPRLKENPAVECWVKDGRLLHEGTNTCQFCDQPLPKDLMAHLAGHFSAEYESLMMELKTFAKTVENAKKEEIALDHKADYYAELTERFVAEKDRMGKL